ncbi:MAG: LacI family DNA-binding transcriptional regulator [Acidobacteria bacterium]|nr:LacI family DNA-binding transcriptional regulator [Acidobacteriota bacterium]
MPTTLQDIAEALGVSTMTVSRAINGNAGIGADLRERVLAVAQQMNYRPNQHARALSTNRSYLIGLIVPDLMHSYFAELAKAIEAVARPAGYEILICNTEENAETELAEVEVLAQRTDGLIIASSAPPEKARAYRKMLKEGAKLVFLDRHFANLSCPAVITDDVKVGRLATEHLIRLGHRRIGHLRGNSVAVAADRVEGYRQALEANKIRFDETLVRPCGFMESDGYQAMRTWLVAGKVPSAIFAANDPSAMGAMAALEDAGLRIPEEVAVVGAGDIHYGDRLKVPLTTVTWDKLNMGRQAAQLMFGLLGKEPTARVGKSDHVICEPSLLVRKSCGATQSSR